MRARHVIVSGFAVALLFSLAAAAEGDEQAGATYIGQDMCVACHDGYAEGLAATPHGKAGFAMLSDLGCEGCHGPGSLHADDPDIEANRPIITTRSPEAQNAICQQCHDGGEQFFWQGSAHQTRNLTCTTCHGVHTFKSEAKQLKAAVVTDQCYECHKDVRAETWKRSHHPIREGRITCVDCHNPHGAQTERMVNAASINDQCYECHTEKRGPFLWDHAPVRESCMNCHTPHGSNHLKLQKTSVPYICQQCHINTRHPGTLYDRTTLADGTNPSNRDFSRACLNCHTAIHGSNHPSGWALYR